MTLDEALRLAAWGGAAGGIGAVITSKIVQSGMHGVKGLDFTYLAGSLLLLGLTMLLASAVPARRASRVDPITVLRQEEIHTPAAGLGQGACHGSAGGVMPGGRRVFVTGWGTTLFAVRRSPGGRVQRSGGFS